MWDALGTRTKGYGLGALCERTLGLEKSGTGEHAPLLVRQGRWGDLFDYNLNDVFLTRSLFNFITTNGYVVDVDGNELDIDAPLQFGAA